MSKNIPEDIKRKVLNEYIYTNRPIKSIAEDCNVLFGDVIVILEEYKSIYGEISRSLKEAKDTFNLEERIYQLREEGLSYDEIEDEVNLSITTIRKMCKKIYAAKGKKEPQVRGKGKKEPQVRGRKKQVINDNIIYNLREKGLSYDAISKELREQGIKISSPTIGRICKETYKLKSGIIPKSKRTSQPGKYNQEINEEIYSLREQMLSYKDIVKELEKQGIDISIETVRKKCKELYAAKGKKEPDLRSKELDAEEMYVLREQGLSYQEIRKELQKQGIDIGLDTVKRKCKELYKLKGKKEPDARNKKIDTEEIYILREQGLSYQEIRKKLQKQGIDIGLDTVRRKCKEIYAIKGEIEPTLKPGKSKKKKKPQLRNKELDAEQIYILREQGLSYVEIGIELEKQGIKTSRDTIRRRCKEIYALKGKKEPVLNGDKIKVDDELIYNLREQGLTYLEISQKLQKQGIKVSSHTIGTRCKEIYASKGEIEPRLKPIKQKQIIDDNQEENQKIYELREQGLSYVEIGIELEKQGIKISSSTIGRRCKEIYALKGKKEPLLNGDKIKVDDELIYNLREQGLTHLEISQELKKQGINVSRDTIRIRCKEIYASKGEIESKSNMTPQMSKQSQRLNEQQLAKAILNLTITRKATMEQIQQIADFYGVNLEKTMNSLEER